MSDGVFLPQISLYPDPDNDARIWVYTPYHPEWNTRAKSIGGCWDPENKTWKFPFDFNGLISDTLIEVFGHDSSPTTLCDVILRIGQPKVTSPAPAESWLLGRHIFRYHSTYKKYTRGPGVEVTSGYLPHAPGLPFIGKPTFLVRDVPVLLAEKTLTNLPEPYTYLGAALLNKPLIEKKEKPMWHNEKSPPKFTQESASFGPIIYTEETLKFDPPAFLNHHKKKSPAPRAPQVARRIHIDDMEELPPDAPPATLDLGLTRREAEYILFSLSQVESTSISKFRRAIMTKMERALGLSHRTF